MSDKSLVEGSAAELSLLSLEDLEALQAIEERAGELGMDLAQSSAHLAFLANVKRAIALKNQ